MKHSKTEFARAESLSMENYFLRKQVEAVEVIFKALKESTLYYADAPEVFDALRKYEEVYLEKE